MLKKHDTSRMRPRCACAVSPTHSMRGREWGERGAGYDQELDSNGGLIRTLLRCQHGTEYRWHTSHFVMNRQLKPLAKSACVYSVCEKSCPETAQPCHHLLAGSVDVAHFRKVNHQPFRNRTVHEEGFRLVCPIAYQPAFHL
jgi:hypothetical protein